MAQAGFKLRIQVLNYSLCSISLTKVPEASERRTLSQRYLHYPSLPDSLDTVDLVLQNQSHPNQFTLH